MRIKFFIVFLLLVSVTVNAQEKLPVGKIKVTDGDTISVRFNNEKPLKIRLVGIDAPEKNQPFGTKCKKLLGKLLKGKIIEIKSYGNDRYGRVLAKIIRDGEDVNLLMLKNGCAWLYENAKTLPVAEQDEYIKAFETARKEKKGLFAKKNPVHPQDFRRRSRQG